MSDQLSKVVAEMRASSDAVDWKLKECADQIEAAMKKGCEGESMSKEAKRGWNKAWPIESATTPAEVDRECAEFVNMVGDEFGNEAGVRLRDLFAILARQLAEAKAGMERRGDDMIVPMKLLDEINTTSAAWQERAEQAESQLAEATRRVGEVEGLVNDALALQQKHYGDGMDTHMALADWARNAKAAIDARLASDSATGEGEGHD